MSAVPVLSRESVPGLAAARVHSAVTTATAELLARGDEALSRACCAPTAGERYSLAYLAALRSATAVLAQRATAGGGRRQVWVVLARVAPELGEWAIFFEEAGRLRRAVESGAGQVSVRQADDLVREAERFTAAVLRCLGLHVVVDS